MFKRFFPLLLLIFLFWCESVNAESISDLKISYYDSLYKYSNSNTWITIPNSYFTINGGLSLNFHYSGSIHTPSNTYTNQYPNVYGRIYLCSDGSMSAGWSPDNTATNVWFYNTNIPCNYYNSTYTAGKLWIGQYTAFPTWYESGVGSFDFYVNTYFDNTSSVQVYSNILSLNQFEPYSYESGSYQALQEILNVLSSQNSQNTTIINNQQQIINSQNQTNDILNNDNTTSATNSGSSWFSGFQIDNTKGFTSIITAPIRLIQGILNGSSSCTNLTIPISLKHNSTTLSNEVSLPCGSILWNNVPNAAVLLYWSTIFGLFAWWVLRDMYKFIDSIRDPDNKTEFLMKL